MHDPTRAGPGGPGPAIPNGPPVDGGNTVTGWSPPVERLALSWDEVALSWLAALGLLTILAVAAIIGRAPSGEVVYVSRAQPADFQLTAGEAAAGCGTLDPAAGGLPPAAAPPPRKRA